jgi:hypothetical protein
MKNRLQSVLVILTVLCSVNCHAQNTNSDNGKVYTEDELSHLITIGMSLADVTNRFGPPGSVLDESGQRRLLLYNFRSQPKKKGPYVAGFDIDTKDEKVIRWSPALAQVGNPLPGGAVRRSGDAAFEIFIGDDTFVELINTVNSQGSADASFFSYSPAMKFVADTWVGRPGEDIAGQQTVLLTVKDADASKLKQLTTQNVGQRLFIISSNKVLAAPKITAPIGTTQLRLMIKATNFFEYPTNR